MGLLKLAEVFDVSLSALAEETRKVFKIKEDAVIAAILLHDVIEDCNKTESDLPVSDGFLL